MTAAAQPAIVVRELRKSYAGRAVVDGLDLEVASGSITALLGPNGAGKTTTVEILEGYRSADAGQVRVLGLDPARHAATLHGRVGLMLQSGGIYPQARPGELIRLYARFYRDPLDPDQLLERVGLADASRVRYRVLSGGQRQRLALALALVGRPELVILDEPTAGMDPAAKAATRELIAELRQGGMTVLLTTHELGDAERLADRVVIMASGRIVAAGSPIELIAGATAGLRFSLDAALIEADRVGLEAALRASAPADEEIRLVGEAPAGRFRVDGARPDPALVATLGAWCADHGRLIVELRTTGATLEERYLELTGEPSDSAQ
ncbi:MAG: type transport system ATP-binding protein [Chloroflexota bacterium]|jgi:ABC-2 type transport system ATP-binding protein|nr:type transport system ATP-binding protein [Chloroflexota bacterium]